MECFKVFVLVGVICAIASANTLTRSDAHNIYLCPDPLAATNVLVSQPVHVAAGLFQVKKYVFKFPSEGVNIRKITCISVQDRANNGKGGYPSIVSGGLNSFSIEIVLTSQLGRSIDFNVELFSL